MKRFFLLWAVTLVVGSCFAGNPSGDEVRLIRNATLVINYAGRKILVDPMLSAKGEIPSFANIQRNPIVDLPLPAEEIIKDIDFLLVTHTHEDHFDSVASNLLNKQLPLLHQPADTTYFRKEKFENTFPVEDVIIQNGITIRRVEAQHGTGEVLQRMGAASGFILMAENHPTVYILGDAVWTEELHTHIKNFDPDYIIVNSGGARVPAYPASPIIMDEYMALSMIENSGKATIIAVHMDALDHCYTTREILQKKASQSNIPSGKLLIPRDGENIQLN